MTAPIITIRNLKKQYESKNILKGINLDIMPGQIIGYIGPNGAGKSTTVKILIGLISDFEGDVSIDGFDVRQQAIEVKKIIGYVPENAEIYDVLSPMEYLTFIGKLYQLDENIVIERATRMLGYLGLGDRLHDRMDTFSKGMRQKVLLVSGLIHNPKIIFLDEPLSGLDANAVIMVKEIISRLVAEGKTVFYCSHMMDVVEKVSDRIIVINDGQIIADGTFQELREKEGDTLEKIFSNLTGKDDYSTDAAGFMNAFEK